MNRRADNWLSRPVFTQYLPRLAVLGAAVKGHLQTFRRSPGHRLKA
jgi:hypothetical protein